MMINLNSVKKNSTIHAIITLVEKVLKALDTGKIVVGVYLDLEEKNIRYCRSPNFTLKFVCHRYKKKYT